ncbi:hypothetical protein HDC93_005682 [Streptomyces sp. AK010]|nr:hypothetical protein [Streptomyces sp. AK010]
MVWISSRTAPCGDQRVIGDEPLLQPVDLGKETTHDDTMLLDAEAVLEGLLQGFAFRAEPSLGQRGQLHRRGHPVQQCLQHRPRGLRPHLRGHRGQLDPGALLHLLQPLDHPDPLLGHRRPRPGQIPQLTKHLHRHEGRAHQPALKDPGDPHRVADIGLAAGHVAQMRRVDQPAGEPPLQRGEDGLPVHPGRLHTDSSTSSQASQSPSSASARMEVLNVRVSAAREPSRCPGERTVATTVSRCTSSPAHRSNSTCIPASSATAPINVPPGRGLLIQRV